MNKKKIIIPSLLAIVASASVVVGTTYALFTSTSESNISITSGNVDLVSSIGTLDLYSALASDYYDPTTDTVEKDGDVIISTLAEDGHTYYNKSVTGTFTTGGTATYSDGTLTLSNIAPGDKVKSTLDFTNNSNIDIKYRITAQCISSDTSLYRQLDFVFNDEQLHDYKKYITSWTAVTAGGSISSIPFAIQLPVTTTNTYQNKTIQIKFTVEAVQGNAYTTDESSISFIPVINQLPTAKELTYNESAQTLINAGQVTNGTFNYTLGTDSTTAPTTGYSTELPTGTNAGDYYVWYKVVGNTGFDDIDPDCVTVNIAKAKVTVPTPETNLVYTGNEQTGVVLPADAKYTLTNNTATNAGDYVAIASLNDTDNYEWDLTTPSTENQNIEYSIAKADVTDAVAPVAKTNLVYNESAQDLVTAGSGSFGSWQYKVGDGTYSTTVPTATNAGTYTVYYKFVADSNHNDIAEASYNVTIAKKDATIDTTNVVKVYTYTGSEQTVNSGATVDSGATLTYTNNTFTDVPEGGTQTVTISAAETDNYNAASTTVDITVNKASQTAPAAPTAASKTASSVTLNAVSTSGHGDVQYAYNSTNEAPTTGWQTSTEFTELSADTTYYFFARFVGNGNYLSATSTGSEIKTDANAFSITPTLTNTTADA